MSLLFRTNEPKRKSHCPSSCVLGRKRGGKRKNEEVIPGFLLAKVFFLEKRGERGGLLAVSRRGKRRRREEFRLTLHETLAG